MKRIYLTEQQLSEIKVESLVEKELKQTINESLGIADKVRDYFIDVMHEVNNILKSKKYDSETHDGYKILNFTIIEYINGSKIIIKFLYYNFYNPKAFEDFEDKYIFDNATINNLFGNIYITVNALAISGQLKKEKLYDSLFHELEHAYEDINSGANLPNDKNYRNRTKYVNVIDNNYYMSLSRAWYYSYKFEQDGFINGLYGELKAREHQIPLITMDELRKTYCYGEYIKFVKAIEFLKKHRNDNELLDLLEKFNIQDINSFIVFCEKRKKEFIRKIGRVIIKYCDDIRKENGCVTEVKTMNQLSDLYLW